MNYPFGFPTALQRPVEVARDTAEIALRNALADDKAHRLNEAYLFVVHVFRAFAHQACEAERQGAWNGAEGREHVDSFLGSELIPHAYDLARVSTSLPAKIAETLSPSEISVEGGEVQVVSVKWWKSNDVITG